MLEIEKETRHDVVAFIQAVSEAVGPASKWVHMGVTSSDILDTSFSLLLKEAATLLIDDMKGLMAVLREKAETYKFTPMIGRTHGIHAEPITFGLKMAHFHDEMRRSLERLEAARERVSYGKISGAVGTYAHVPPFVEEYVCAKVGLKPAPISTQILPRDYYAEFFTTLAIIGSSLEKLATEIRHLQRTEVGEAEEFFQAGQTGSSAMPHKRNPIGSENISGLARLLRGYALSALENIPLWHERDISHSSVERVIGPDSTILLDYMLGAHHQPLPEPGRLPRADAKEHGPYRGSLSFGGHNAQPRKKGPYQAGGLQDHAVDRHGLFPGRPQLHRVLQKG